MDVQALLILLAIVFVAGVMVGYGIRSVVSKARRDRMRKKDKSSRLRTDVASGEQILLFLCTSTGKISTADLKNWTGYKNATYFKKLLREMHEDRLIELAGDGANALILPPGDKIASELIAKRGID